MRYPIKRPSGCFVAIGATCGLSKSWLQYVQKYQVTWLPGAGGCGLTLVLPQTGQAVSAIFTIGAKRGGEGNGRLQESQK